jgi:hydrogenase nickel incorporation protein HypA/HybF
LILGLGQTSLGTTRETSRGDNEMHEVGIMQEGVRMAIETARARQASRITRIRLRVGALSGVAPDALCFAFDVVSRDTLAEGAALEIENVPAACWCDGCAAEFDCVDFVNECPRCHALSGELRRGRELELASVEIA